MKTKSRRAKSWPAPSAKPKWKSFRSILSRSMPSPRMTKKTRRKKSLRMETISRMTTKRKTKKKFDMHLDFLRHPLSPFGHLTNVRLTIALIGWAWLAGALVAVEPASSAQNSSGSHAHDFVIFTTVFDSRGFALFGALVRLRRSEEKKFRWEAMSDHSG